MSLEYATYLANHIAGVNNCIKWMNRHNITNEQIRIQPHDASKYSTEEYNAYDLYFYGKSSNTEDEVLTREEINKKFDYAWLHHIHNNPHHWQYWLLQEDEESLKALEMPVEYVYEMIADWWSFSWAKGDYEEIFSWYDSHKDKMILNENTRKLVEEILEKIRAALNEPESYTLLQTD